MRRVSENLRAVEPTSALPSVPGPGFVLLWQAQASQVGNLWWLQDKRSC
jgi:hypothetical protein